jgi:two-component system sensor histidine kinase HydH
LLSDVLDFAKPLSLNLGKTNLKDILMQCIENLKPQIEEKQIIMKLKYSKRIPSLRLDEEKIKQAFYNILLNAIQAIDKGGRVEITGTMKKQNVILRIIDNGCGIKKPDMPFIFDPFFSTKPKGTGLGLPLAKKIIEAHGGAINVNAKRPKGTCVEVIIPVKE